MEDGTVRQSKEPLIQHQTELHTAQSCTGLTLSLDAGTMASPEGVSERMVDERRRSSDSINKSCGMRTQEQVKRGSTGSRELVVHFEESGESDAAPPPAAWNWFGAEPGPKPWFVIMDSREERDADPAEDPLTTSLMELSVLDRLGLHRMALTEQDVEAAFAQLALAFRCDMFTLRRRVQVEERARNTAEGNIQKELAECQTVLQMLDQACMDSRRKELIEQLQSSLTVLAGAMERATVAAEKLGAVHQEARMSRATEVMVQHVENLKRHHLREHTELEEMKRLIQQNSRNRQLAENRDDGEQRLKHPPLRMFQQGSARRRVSIAVIPRQLMQFNSPENGTGSEGEAVKPTAMEEESLERRSRCLQEDSVDSYFALHAGSSSSSHQSLLGPNSMECDRDRHHYPERRESELRSRSSLSKTVEEEPDEEESGSEGLNEESEELEERALLSKGYKMELCRAWFSMPTYYWVLLWLFFLGIACLVLIRILELQKQYPFPISDS